MHIYLKTLEIDSHVAQKLVANLMYTRTGRSFTEAEDQRVLDWAEEVSFG